MNHFENLSKFFERIKNISFWQRIFSWNTLKSLSYDAYEEFKLLLNTTSDYSERLIKTEGELNLLKKDIEQIEQLKRDVNQLNNENGLKTKELSDIKGKLETYIEKDKNNSDKVTDLNQQLLLRKKDFDDLNKSHSDLAKENTIFKQTEQDRRHQHDKSIAEVNALRAHFESELKRMQLERENEINDRFDKMKATWSNHEVIVEESIKALCKKHIIEYVGKEKVPFKGKPDNAIKICDEYIIFDSKSPANDNFENFPKYIRDQTESVKKYIKEQGVKRDIFLVIPSNTTDVIKQYSYNMGDYNVFVVTLDVLEPIILSLKKLEDYQFVDQLSPEERDNICRVIGKFAHTTKRKIQIDQFFSEEFFSILNKCKTDLPKDVLEKVIEFEKAEKLNPPTEKRAKQILTSELEKNNLQIKKEAEAKDISFTSALKGINEIPLYSEEGGKKE